MTRGAAAPSDNARPTTLVVEDEPAVRGLTRRVLVREGHRVLEAASGTEARAVAAAHAGRIDLLVTDLQLPDAEGRALAADLRAMRPALRVLVVSGYGDATAGPNSPLSDARFLGKPFTPAELADAVRAALAV